MKDSNSKADLPENETASTLSTSLVGIMTIPYIPTQELYWSAHFVASAVFAYATLLDSSSGKLMKDPCGIPSRINNFTGTPKSSSFFAYATPCSNIGSAPHTSIYVGGSFFMSSGEASKGDRNGEVWSFLSGT